MKCWQTAWALMSNPSLLFDFDLALFCFATNLSLQDLRESMGGSSNLENKSYFKLNLLSSQSNAARDYAPAERGIGNNCFAIESHQNVMLASRRESDDGCLLSNRLAIQSVELRRQGIRFCIMSLIYIDVELTFIPHIAL